MLLGRQAGKWLVDRFGKRIRFDEPMSRHTSFRVGGPADAFIALRGIEELTMLVGFCREKGIPYLVVGDGTNLLVADKGIRGVVMTLASKFREIHRIKDDGAWVTVRAMAGARTRMLCRYATDAGLAGMNFAVGIPGTVGGALMMNAGTPRGCMADVVEAVEAFHPDGVVKRYPREALRFSYRGLRWGAEPTVGTGEAILLSGDFQLTPSDVQAIREEARTILETRRKRQPWRSPSAGCFFKNPSKNQSAGELIDLAGLKGKTIGGACVSRRHANFIVNTGGATASDILRLMEEIREAVQQAFGIALEPEVKIVGI